jgi:hypothetical protein
MNRVPITAWLMLRNEADRRSLRPSALCIRGFIAGADDNRDLLNSGRERLFNQDSEQRFLVAVSIDKGLKR